MRLGSSTTIRLGLVPGTPIETPQGQVRVDAVGLVALTRWGGLRWLRPLRVTVDRADGSRQRAWVRARADEQLLMLAGIRAALGRLLPAPAKRK